MLVKNCLKKKIMNMLPNNPGIINGNKLSIQPIFENIMNCGIITTGYGIITEAKSAMKILFFPANCNFEKANAAKLEVNVPITVTVIATIKLLPIPDKSGPIPQISVYLLKEIVCGIHTGGRAKTSSFDLSEVE